MEDKTLHTLNIANGEVKLDDFTLKGVTGYEIKSSAVGTTELVLKMVVGVSNIFVD